jgi:hypothetical protein
MRCTIFFCSDDLGIGVLTHTMPKQKSTNAVILTPLKFSTNVILWKRFFNEVIGEHLECKEIGLRKNAILQ